MCALFGIINYKHLITKRQCQVLFNRLAAASEVRGTDASGIAYVKNGKPVIYKRPLPAHKMRFSVPSDTTIVTGHTRMATQGSAEFNENNHPFYGKTESGSFALCHNGIICNDEELVTEENLPITPIQTDSYVAVQLIEKEVSLSFDSIARMCEKVRGSFVFTILGDDNTLYIAKGDNPICLIHFRELGIYVYTSTADIMNTALSETFIMRQDFEQIEVTEGDIIRINREGMMERCRFVPRCYDDFDYRWYGVHYRAGISVCDTSDISEEDLDLLFEMGYDENDIDILSNDRELLKYCIDEAKLMLGFYDT